MQIRVFAYFQFDHFPKLKIDSESRFEKRMSIFQFFKKLKRFCQYLKKSKNGFPIVFSKSDFALAGVNCGLQIFNFRTDDILLLQIFNFTTADILLLEISLKTCLISFVMSHLLRVPIGKLTKEQTLIPANCYVLVSTNIIIVTKAAVFCIFSYC